MSDRRLGMSRWRSITEELMIALTTEITEQEFYYDDGTKYTPPDYIINIIRKAVMDKCTRELLDNLDVD